MTNWKPIETIPYDEVVLVKFASGNVVQTFHYDETLEQFIKTMTRKPLPDELIDPPVGWMDIPN